MGSSGPSHVLPSGWYIEDPKEGILLGNLPVNTLDEWDVAKLGRYFRNTGMLWFEQAMLIMLFLGWFKSRSPTEDHIDATGQQIIRQAFKVEVEDCGLNQFKYQVSRNYCSIHIKIRRK